MSQFYVTTPLYYVNDKPHLGHAYTTVAADVLSRWYRLKGFQVHFLTGTDEHGQKVYEAAQKRGMSPKEHTDDMVQPFQKLWDRLDISYNDFIRTTEERHTKTVQKVLQELFENGDIFEDEYEGWYSTTAEKFWTEKDLIDGKCPDTGKEVQWIAEKNYFFKMSKYTTQIEEWIQDNPECILPISRRNEVLGYLRSKEVGNLCISRPKERLPWGIPLPFDTNFVTYVWFDALLNYISSLGFDPTLEVQPKSFEQNWPYSVQLLGKDILTTHTIYWWSMLFALGLTPPKQIFAHGWWTVEGQKMSKSTGNVVDPNLLIDCYGSDTIRFFVLREIPFGGDGDFGHQKLLTRYNTDLANDLGNLLHRAISMGTKWLGGSIPELDEAQEIDIALQNKVEEKSKQYVVLLENLQFYQAIESLFEMIREGNKYIDTEQPWRLNKEGNTVRLGGVMRRCLEICRIAAWLLSPILPNKSQELLEQLHSSTPTNLHSLDGLTAGSPLEMRKPLFPRQRELPEKIQVLLAELRGEDPQATKKNKKQQGNKQQSSKPKTIKLKVFQRVPFCSGKITDASQEGEELHISVNVGSETVLIRDAFPSNFSMENLIGKDVAIAKPETIGDFEKIQLRAAQIKSAQVHPDAEKLLCLRIDVGEEETRSVVAGIANRFSPEDLIDQKVTLVSNLKPSKLRGVPSQGMLMAAGGEQLQSLVVWPDNTGLGTIVELFGSAPNCILTMRNSDKTVQFMELSEDTIAGSIIR